MLYGYTWYQLCICGGIGGNKSLTVVTSTCNLSMRNFVARPLFFMCFPLWMCLDLQDMWRIWNWTDCLHARCIFSSAFIKSAFQIIIRDRFREATLFQPSVKYWVTPKHLHMSTPLKMNSKVMQYPTLPHVSSCVATIHSSRLSKLHECQQINQ